MPQNLLLGRRLQINQKISSKDVDFRICMYHVFVDSCRNCMEPYMDEPEQLGCFGHMKGPNDRGEFLKSILLLLNVNHSIGIELMISNYSVYERNLSKNLNQNKS